MNKINIGKIDLNLLLIFHAVMEQKTTVKAAHLLGLSQPAISHGLNRLRDLLNDRLFVRASRGVIPTPKALEIEPIARELLERAEKIFLNSPKFEPIKAKNTFRIATTDYFEHLVMPFVFRKLEKEAPDITVICRPLDARLPESRLESGEFDLAIAGFFKDIPDSFIKQKLFSDDHVCIVNKNKTFGKTLTLQKYAEQKHIISSPHGDLKTRSREILKKHGYDLQYVGGVSGFLSPARILSMTDLVMTCSRLLASTYAEAYPLKIYELPFQLMPFTLVQVWHERQQDDQAHKWFRGLIHEVCNQIN